MKNLLFILSVCCLFACSNNHRKFDNIAQAKQYAESNGYKVLFETDSTLTYLSPDTLFVYGLKYDITEKITENDIIYGDIELDLNKLYPMELNFVPSDKRIIGDNSLFKILLNDTILLSSNHNLIFNLKNQDDMLGDVDVLYDFSVKYLPDIERLRPTLTRLEYDCNYLTNDNGITFKKITYQPQYPAGFRNALRDIVSNSSLNEKFEEGGALIVDISIDNNGNISSILPSNIMFGYHGDVNIPIYEYGDGKDLLQAIEVSL